MPRLVVSHNGQNYQIIDLDGTVHIGRDEHNDIVLPLPGVSRIHASLAREKGHYYLVDHNSTNGTWIQSEKISRYRLHHCDTFSITEYTFTYLEDLALCERSVPAERCGDVSDKTMILDRSRIEAVARPEPQTVARATLKDIHALLRELETCNSEEQLLEVALNSLYRLYFAECGFITGASEYGKNVVRCAIGATDLFRSVNRQLVKLVLSSGEIEKASFRLERKLPDGSDRCIGLGAPLKLGEAVDGCLSLFRPSGNAPFTSEESELLGIVARNIVLLQRQFRRGWESSGFVLSKDAMHPGGIIAVSSVMERLCRDIHTIAPVNAPTLILGESGSGKELVARALHELSERSGPLVTLNCSAIPEGIFESELFGSVKGAFHNATDRAGSLEQANKGTIFLDEIGDMDVALQPKLLRFLENRELTRLGDTRPRRLDVRIVAATNQDLDEMIANKTFRDDLYQRLCCFTIHIPPLREHLEDIEPLANHFLREFSKEYGWPEVVLPRVGVTLLQKYHWPGNVRELKNMMLRLYVNTRGRNITVDDIQAVLGQFRGNGSGAGEFQSMEDVEKQHILSALRTTGWNVSAASRLLGIARSTFYQKIKKYQIKTNG